MLLPVDRATAAPPAQHGWVGLYDAEGVLRCTAQDPGECLAYAELFALDPEACSLVSFN